MRIIAGRWRSHRIVAKGRTVRPTTDRARQVLFDILGPEVIEKDVLDLYAGSGALGLEALSRGARSVLFVDMDSRACAGIKWNIGALAAWDQTEIWNRRVSPALTTLLGRGSEFDWILADPPYGKGEEAKILEMVGGKGSALLRAGGGLVLESNKEAALPEESGTLELTRLRPFGGSTLRIYRHRGGGDEV